MFNSKISRREVLRYSLASAGLLAMGPLGRGLSVAEGSPQNLKRLVVIYCYGGNDTTNMVAPVTLDAYQDRRVGLALGETDGHSLNTGPGATTAYRLHPAMPKTAALWSEGSVAAVQRVGYPQENLSHFASTDIYAHGVRGNFADLGLRPSGWLARLADAHAPTPLGAVSVGVGRPDDLEGGTSNPLMVRNLASFKIDRYWDANAHDHRIETAKKILDRYSQPGDSSEVKAGLANAHDLADQIQQALSDYSSTVTYENRSVSRYLKDIAVLIQGGFESRVFYTGFGGFDHHSAQGAGSGRHANLLGYLDEGIGAFADDMKAMGIWDDTVVVVVTEFGRRNFVNASEGTDHGHGACALVYGGTVNGGIYGQNLTETDLEARWLSYDVDFRSIYKEILTNHLDMDAAAVFPEALEKETNLGIV